MNNLRLLAGVLCVLLPGVGALCQTRRVVTLEEIYRTAEAGSAKLRTAYASEREAYSEIAEKRDARLPDISAEASVGFIGDGFTAKRDFTDYQRAPIPHLSNGIGLTVSQPLYTGGAIKNSIEMAELKSTAARFATDLQRDNLRMRLTGYYLDIYKYHNLRRVVESNLAAAQRVLKDMHARYEQGTVLLNDITRFELLVSNLELEITRIDNTLRILNNNLVTLAGMAPETVIIPDSTLIDRAVQVPGLSQWQQEATESSPQLKLARNGVEISRKAEELVLADRRPKIGVQAGWSLNGPILVEVPPINRNLSYWYVGVGISYNISSLYKNNRTRARSRAATVVAQNRLDEAGEDVALAVNEAHIRWQESQTELATRNKGVELAMRNYKTVSTRYGAGMALITDLLDAANSRLDAEQQLVNARINIIYNYYRLLFTSGKI